MNLNLQAHDFPENLEWLNVKKPLKMADLRGYIVILDFWTYCCINCIHVLSDLKQLEKKYENDPLIVIGVHSPKFKNEKIKENVVSAVERYEISHPILLDNEFVLWKKYKVFAWPTLILIGPNGQVISKAAGEGSLDSMEEIIEKLLVISRNNYEPVKKSEFIVDQEPKKSILRFPGKLAFDEENDILFISDSNNNRILAVKIKEKNHGEILKIIGSGAPGFKDGSFASAKFDKPQGIVFHDGVLYIADTENHSIRMVDFSNFQVRTVAGTGNKGYRFKYHGDPLNASLNSPWDLDFYENYLYITMAGSHQIWRLNMEQDIIEILAGNGREALQDGPLNRASLAQPSGISIDSDGKKVYFLDSESSSLRYVDLVSKEVLTIIGKGLFEFGHENGNFPKALMQHPIGLDVNGDKIFVADTYNHAIRTVYLNKLEIQDLISQSTKSTCTINGKSCDYLPLFEPNDVLMIKDKLYIADTNNHLVRIYDFNDHKLHDLKLKYID